jgi:hypothetical protein
MQGSKLTNVVNQYLAPISPQAHQSHVKVQPHIGALRLVDSATKRVCLPSLIHFIMVNSHAEYVPLYILVDASCVA